MTPEATHLHLVEPDEETQAYQAHMEAASIDPMVDAAAVSLVLSARGYPYHYPDSAPTSYSDAVMELAKMYGLELEDAEQICDRRVDKLKEELGFGTSE